MWSKFIFPVIVIVIVVYWLLLSEVSLSTHFAVFRQLQCLLNFRQLFSAQKCNITGHINIVGNGLTTPLLSPYGFGCPRHLRTYILWFRHFYMVVFVLVAYLCYLVSNFQSIFLGTILRNICSSSYHGFKLYQLRHCIKSLRKI